MCFYAWLAVAGDYLVSIPFHDGTVKRFNCIRTAPMHRATHAHATHSTCVHGFMVPATNAHNVHLWH